MPTTRPSASRAELREAADALLTASSLDPDLLPCAVGLVDPDGSGSALAVRPLTGRHPVDDLLGFVAPPHWRAVGLVVRGTARPLPDSAAVAHRDTGAPAIVTAPTPLCLVHLQPRRGPALSLLDLDDRAGVQELSGVDAGGRVADACLRALGRRTASPVGTAQILGEVVWIDRLLRAVVGQPHGRLSSAEMRALHPLVSGPRTTTGVGDADPHQLGPLARLGGALGWPTRWRTWRRGLAAGDEAVLGIDPTVAEWMDDGMFQRWFHGELPPLAGLVDDFAALVPRSVLHDILEVMSTLRAPHPSSPTRSGSAP